MFDRTMSRREALCTGAALLAAAYAQSVPGADAPARPTHDAVFQYAVRTKDVNDKEVTAFLWVPPEAERVRGVLVGGLTLMEQEFVEDPLIRKVCAKEQLAIVYLFPAFDANFDYKGKGAGRRLQQLLDDLGEASGYPEIATAPLFPFGHSVGTIFATHVVCWDPARCFGALLFKGGIPLPTNDPDASIAGVPILVVKGQFEEFGPGPSGVLREFEDRETAWKGMDDTLQKLRAKDPNNLIAYLVEAGATHFAWSSRVSEYAALFLGKAARSRIPNAPTGAKGSVKCRDLNPADGALTGCELGKDSLAAAYRDFQGDRKRAFWHLDARLARAADEFHAELFAKKPQFVTFADPKNGKSIPVGHDLRLRLGLNWTGPDTFRVAGKFLDRAPDKYPPVEGAVRHADGPVRFRVFGGSAEQIGADTFRVCLSGRRKPQADLLAYHPGDATYRHAEQQGRLALPERLTAGKKQTITFPVVGEVAADGPPVKLRAASDAGLPVRYYVESGPAVIEGNVLRIVEIPRRAKYPLRVTVIAYQYGSAVGPFVQSAERVQQVILVRK